MLKFWKTPLTSGSENMQKSCFIWRTWRKNVTSCVMGTSTLLIGILTRNILKLTRFKSYGSNSGFRVFGDLDLWPMFYFFLSHALRMVYWNIQAKFHKNPSSMNGWYAAVKVLKNVLCFIMGYLVAMEIRVALLLLMQFFMLYSIGPINVCTDFEINPYKIDEVRKYAKIVFYLTPRDAKTLRHASWGLRHFW